MARTRAEWIEEANKKSDGGMYTGVVIFAKVENLSEALLNRYGRFQHTELNKALRGEKDGHWRIVDVLGEDGEGNVVACGAGNSTAAKTAERIR